jgi:hypothetical protein
MYVLGHDTEFIVLWLLLWFFTYTRASLRDLADLI